MADLTSTQLRTAGGYLYAEGHASGARRALDTPAQYRQRDLDEVVGRPLVQPDAWMQGERDGYVEVMTELIEQES